MRNQKGITLIALVITIIVLLILAGVTIAMLSGENGILSRSTETRSKNAESQATEQAKLAYMTVRTEIASKMTQDGNYDAVANTTTPDPRITGDTTLLSKVISDLGFTSGATTGWVKCEETTSGSGIITLLYRDSSLEKDLEYTITMSEKSAGFSGPTEKTKPTS